MLRLDNDKIRELIANAGDTSNLGNAYSAKKYYKIYYSIRPFY
jgi:hypothetical protein